MKITAADLGIGEASNNEANMDASCLNSVFDAIFVISVAARMDTLRLTLYQLHELNINYTLWEGHSDANQYSLALFRAFQLAIQIEMQHNAHSSLHEEMMEIEMIGKDNPSLYENARVFFLRQTQIDIIKYSKSRGYRKILILEDDIVLSNANIWRLFCEMEPYLPEWYVLNLGVNQFHLKRFGIRLYDIPQHQESEMKYSIKDEFSFGTFGTAFSSKMYSTLIELYDFDVLSNTSNVNIWPLDAYYRFIANNAEISNKCFNFHPTLIIPDVSRSSLRPARNQMKMVKEHAIHNISYFSKYWGLRFQHGFQHLLRGSPSKHYVGKV